MPDNSPADQTHKLFAGITRHDLRFAITSNRAPALSLVPVDGAPFQCLMLRQQGTNHIRSLSILGLN